MNIHTCYIYAYYLVPGYMVTHEWDNQSKKWRFLHIPRKAKTPESFLDCVSKKCFYRITKKRN